MPVFTAGRRVAVQWVPRGSWETRILIARCDAAAAKAEGDVDATPAQEKAGTIWYALSPDLDIYPHILETGEGLLSGIVAFDNEGETIPGSNLGAKWSARSAAYGD